MNARALLRLLLLVQALAAAAIGVAAARWLHAGALGALLAGVGAVALVRLAISANNFAMSARAASATPASLQLGRRAGLRLFAEEFAASMRYSSWFMPRAAPVQRVHPASPAPPVLLLHGYGCNCGYWVHLAPLLDAARISHASVDLDPLACSIDAYVPQVEAGARALLDATGAQELVIVAHSMGGLVARAWMRAHGNARVARIVTLGTPHHGTRLARFGVGANSAQMRPGSAWLRELAAAEDGQARARITSIYSHHDNIVAPQTSSHLPGAHNIDVGGVGHVALGANRRVLELVLRELARTHERPSVPRPAQARRAGP